MTTVAVDEVAESTAIRGFWTRSHIAGIVYIVAGAAVVLLAFVALTGDDNSVFGFVTDYQVGSTLAAQSLDQEFALPSRPIAAALGALCAAGGALLLTGIGRQRFGLVSGVAIPAAAIGVLFWAFARTPEQTQVVVPLEAMISGSILLSLPLIFGSLAGVLCERSGVINVGIEGQLLAGAFTGVLVANVTDSPYIGMIGAALAGSAVTAILGALAVRYQVDQVVLGVVLNFLVLGLTGFLFARLMQADEQRYNLAVGVDRVGEYIEEIPVLGDWLLDIPFLGPVLADQNLFTYIAVALAIGIWFALFHSSWGLRTRSVGEHPAAADTVGIRVNPLRFRNVAIAGLVSGLGGAFFTIGSNLPFNPNMTIGKGFIALAVLIVGRWNPLGALAGALLFGFTDQLQGFMASMAGGAPISQHFLAMLPYLVTIVVVAGLIGRVKAPAADGKPYVKA